MDRRFELLFGLGGVDVTGQFGTINKDRNFIGINFGKATHQGNGLPCIALTYPQNPIV